MKLKRLCLTALLVLALLLLAGCQGNNGAGKGNDAGSQTAGDTSGNTSGNTSGDTADDPAEEAGTESQDGGDAAPSGPVAVGDAYRDFTTTLVDGSEFTLSDQEGKVILLNFWATWCGPCVGEMPAFTRLVETYGEDLALLAVNCGEDEETVTAFLEKNEYTFPVALDPEYAVCLLYPSEFIPYTVIIGTDGKMAAIETGADDADSMYTYYCEVIDGLLEE